MAAIMGCIGGQEIHRQWDAGKIAGRSLGCRQTPFGPSGEVLLAEGCEHPFYLLFRYGSGLAKPAASKVNYRANIYALKDLGVEAILAWGPAGAIPHEITLGDLVILSDVIDQTYRRADTFFETSPLGFLRQFPVFCPAMQQGIARVLGEKNLPHRTSGVAVIREGPRLETPAEVAVLAGLSAHVVTHTFAPEMFLAKELQLCYAAVCYVVNYAEMGSRHKPFVPGSLFGGLAEQSRAHRLTAARDSMLDVVRGMAAEVAAGTDACECRQTMAHYVARYGLPDDWRKWIG